MAFPLSAATQGLISDLIRLDEIATRLQNEEGEAADALQHLQGKRIDALINAASISPGAIDIRCATEKCVDIRSQIVACQSKRSELISQISASMQSDKAGHRKEVEAEKERLLAEQEECRKEYLTALAVAAVAQMRYLGWWQDMGRKGPGLGSHQEEDWNFFRNELSRLCEEAGLESDHRPLSDRIKIAANRALGLGRPVAAGDVQEAIEAVRRIKRI
jgi:hypothetical protein